MTLEELLKQKIERQESILNDARTLNRDLTSEEDIELKLLQKDIEELQKSIENSSLESPLENQSENPVETERKRILEINELCRNFGLNSEEYIKKGSSIEDVRKIIIQRQIEENPPIGVRGAIEINDAEDKFRSAMADALLIRGGVQVENPVEGARELAGMTLRDLAIESLEKCGEYNLNRCSSDDLFNLLSRQYYNPTNSFLPIMDNAINKAYIEGHKKVAVTFDRWTKKGTLNDFKTHDNNYLAGPVGELLEVPEGAELQHDAWKDEKRPTRKLKTYGRQFTMTRQAFINDDIGLITSLPAKYAASARKTINKQCYQILVNNPAVYDGIPLFSKEHKNVLKAGSGISGESIMKMFSALQMQENEFGEAIIINPAIIIVPVGYAMKIYEVFYSPTIHTSSNTQAINPLFHYKEMIEIVEDPTINVLCKDKEMPWFVLGSKSDTDFVEVDYLNGQEIPNIRRMETAGVLGFTWDVFLDWGISVMDFRGAIKNSGIKLVLPLD